MGIDDLGDIVADAVEKETRRLIEEDYSQGELECDCGSESFDIETWESSSENLQGAAVCRSCGSRIDIKIDTSDIDELRR